MGLTRITLGSGIVFVTYFLYSLFVPHCWEKVKKNLPINDLDCTRTLNVEIVHNNVDSNPKMDSPLLVKYIPIFCNAVLCVVAGRWRTPGSAAWASPASQPPPTEFRVSSTTSNYILLRPRVSIFFYF